MPGGNPADKAAATHGYNQGIENTFLGLQLARCRALTRNGFRLVIGVNHKGAALPNTRFARGQCFRVGCAYDIHIRAVISQPLDLHRR